MYNQIGIGDGNHLSDTIANGTNAARAALQTELSVFSCPSDTGDSLNRERRYEFDDFMPGALASDTAYSGNGHALTKSNYVGVNGQCGVCYNRSAYDDDDATGVFLNNRVTKIRDITDGTSNTFMLGERATFVNGPNGRFTIGAAVVYGYRDNSSATTNTSNPSDGAIMVVGGFRLPINTTTNAARRGFSSNHVGGCHFVMADGTVRFVSENIELQSGAPFGTSGSTQDTCSLVDSLAERLASIADGQPIGEF